MPVKRPPSCRQAGFSLLEILVSIVVISLGLLGLASLQATSLNNNQSAYLRTLASQQAYDMADRMRANLAGVTQGQYNNLNGALATIWSTKPNLVPACLNANCTASALATEDYRQWRAANDRLLPSGSGTVCLASNASPDTVYPCNSNNTCATAANYDPTLPFIIEVEWTEKAATGNVTQGFCTAFRP